jgi:hypothetical protein
LEGGAVNPSTPWPEGLGLLRVDPERRFFALCLKGGAWHRRMGQMDNFCPYPVIFSSSFFQQWENILKSEEKNFFILWHIKCTLTPFNGSGNEPFDFHRSKAGVCSGLILSGVFNPVVKDRITRHRSIKIFRRLKWSFALNVISNMTPWKNFARNAGSSFCLWTILLPQKREHE